MGEIHHEENPPSVGLRLLLMSPVLILWVISLAPCGLFVFLPSRGTWLLDYSPSSLIPVFCGFAIFLFGWAATTFSEKRFHFLFGVIFLLVILNIAGWIYAISQIH